MVGTCSYCQQHSPGPAVLAGLVNTNPDAPYSYTAHFCCSAHAYAGQAAAQAELDRRTAERYGDNPDRVRDLVQRRNDARAAKDWAEADAVRDELHVLGWTVKDTPTGTEVHRSQQRTMTQK